VAPINPADQRAVIADRDVLHVGDDHDDEIEIGESAHLTSAEHPERNRHNAYPTTARSTLSTMALITYIESIGSLGEGMFHPDGRLRDGHVVSSPRRSSVAASATRTVRSGEVR
jgi:hypothetical protein